MLVTVQSASSKFRGQRRKFSHGLLRTFEEHQQLPQEKDRMDNMSTIPRFLLSQRGIIWRTRLSISQTPTTSGTIIRYASKSVKKSSKSSKPLVLEKPTKFNPPSHGSRIRKDPPRYPGPQLSAEEQARQPTKQYPNMMPPEGSFLHWFINNRTIHLCITLVSSNTST